MQCWPAGGHRRKLLRNPNFLRSVLQDQESSSPVATAERRNCGDVQNNHVRSKLISICRPSWSHDLCPHCFHFWSWVHYWMGESHWHESIQVWNRPGLFQPNSSGHCWCVASKWLVMASVFLKEDQSDSCDGVATSHIVLATSHINIHWGLAWRAWCVYI